MGEKIKVLAGNLLKKVKRSCIQIGRKKCVILKGYHTRKPQRIKREGEKEPPWFS
jgi:hypothetical protein